MYIVATGTLMTGCADLLFAVIAFYFPSGLSGRSRCGFTLSAGTMFVSKVSHRMSRASRAQIGSAIGVSVSATVFNAVLGHSQAASASFWMCREITRHGRRSSSRIGQRCGPDSLLAYFVRDVVLKSPTACYFAHPGFSGTILCAICLCGVGIVVEAPAIAQVPAHPNPEDGDG